MKLFNSLGFLIPHLKIRGLKQSVSEVPSRPSESLISVAATQPCVPAAGGDTEAGASRLQSEHKSQGYSEQMVSGLPWMEAL